MKAVARVFPSRRRSVGVAQPARQPPYIGRGVGEAVGDGGRGQNAGDAEGRRQLEFQQKGQRAIGDRHARLEPDGAEPIEQHVDDPPQRQHGDPGGHRPQNVLTQFHAAAHPQVEKRLAEESEDRAAAQSAQRNHDGATENSPAHPGVIATRRGVRHGGPQRLRHDPQQSERRQAGPLRHRHARGGVRSKPRQGDDAVQIDGERGGHAEDEERGAPLHERQATARRRQSQGRQQLGISRVKIDRAGDIRDEQAAGGDGDVIARVGRKTGQGEQAADRDNGLKRVPRGRHMEALQAGPDIGRQAKRDVDRKEDRRDQIGVRDLRRRDPGNDRGGENRSRQGQGERHQQRGSDLATDLRHVAPRDVLRDIGQ